MYFTHFIDYLFIHYNYVIVGLFYLSVQVMSMVEGVIISCERWREMCVSVEINV